jgi:pSer/pThr/pTyr-binding forkhead associated (FHA) protein
LILEQSYTSFAMAENLYRLVVKAGPNPGSAFDLSKEVTLMGRDVTNDISLGDPEVSRQHARLTRTPGGYVLEDLGSTNGSFVNGERLVAPRVLTSGDLLGMGENVTLSFEGASPETAQTVMGEAVQHGAAPTPEAMQEAIARPTPVPVAEAEPSDGKGRTPWLLAAAGCLGLLIICAATLFLMDAFAPDILYAPLRVLGIVP